MAPSSDLASSPRSRVWFDSSCTASERPPYKEVPWELGFAFSAVDSLYPHLHRTHTVQNWRSNTELVYVKVFTMYSGLSQPLLSLPFPEEVTCKCLAPKNSVSTLKIFNDLEVI